MCACVLVVCCYLVAILCFVLVEEMSKLPVSQKATIERPFIEIPPPTQDLVEGESESAQGKKRSRAEQETPIPDVPYGVTREQALDVLKHVISYHVLQMGNIFHLQQIQRKWSGNAFARRGKKEF